MLDSENYIEKVAETTLFKDTSLRYLRIFSAISHVKPLFNYERYNIKLANLARLNNVIKKSLFQRPQPSSCYMLHYVESLLLFKPSSLMFE